MSKSENHNKGNETAVDPKSDPAGTGDSVRFFQEWLADLSGACMADWDRLPDIGLYMDQVLTLMDRQLALYRRNDDDRLLTQPMINNYTKDGLLPRATDKKYAQGHLALLSVLCSLKPVLSISDLSVLLQNAQSGSDERRLYEYFLDSQKDAIESTRRDVLPDIESLVSGESDASVSGDESRRDLALLALRMAVEARLRIMMTQKILDLIGGEKK